MISMLACEGPSSTPTPQQLEGYRSNLATHKVQLSAEQAQELEKRGAKMHLIGDYGSFKLVEVDEQVLSSLPEGAEPRDELNDILLNAGTIDTASAHGQSLRGMKSQATGKRFHLVQFAGPIQPEWYKSLEATGVQVVSYIPNNTYLVYGDAQALSTLQQQITTKAAPAIQWNGDYLDDFKLNPAIHTVKSETYEVQLIKDEAANGPTLELIRGLQAKSGTIQESLGYVNVHTYLAVKDLYEIASRPDVISIQPRPMPRKFDERQNMIVSGQLTGTQPNPPNWLAWLAEKGFTQAQFTASGFGVDVTDSGVDNAVPAAPNHFGLYVGGNISNTSRLIYSRLEGTPHGGSTIQGCDGHGNLNAHIIGGYSNQTGAPFEDAAGFNYGLGVAPFVKVGSSVIFDPGTFTSPIYEDLQSRAYRDGMRVSSNSWGANTSAYTSDAQRYDALVRDAQPGTSAVPAAGNQEMVIVFAAGNAGPGAGTVGSPGTAKNIITAGASENVQAFGGADQCAVPDSDANSGFDIVGFSSRGPAADGRKKPELVAPGTHVSGGVAQVDGQRANPPANPNGQALGCFDASGVCAGPGSSNYWPLGQQWYTASSGTSHSTPAIAGGAALVRQYFINQSMAPPSAAMTKAYLMNSARYMTGSAANDNLWSNNQGMGLMDLGMAFDGIPRLLDDQNPANLFTATGQTHEFNGVVADSSKPFRVTVAWTDAPGSTTGSAWRNNLDLTLTIGANTYRGNVFTGANSVTGGTADGSNNVESVFLPAGVSGPFTVTVTAANINSDGLPGNSSPLDQDFALIAYNTCQDAPPTITGVTATVNGNNRIDVAWTDNGAGSYNIYRATTAGGPYTRVGTTAGSPFPDTTVSGGITYYYVVRGVDCAESPDSNEASATATGTCTLPPDFGGATSATNAGTATCGNTVAWSAGTPICGGTLSYSVYRSTTAGFTPSIGNRIATGVTGTSFADDLNLTQGTRYYYVVRATETGAATVEETNTVERSAVPTGVVTPGVRYFDDLDGTRPPSAASYWIATASPANTINLVNGCHYQSATRSYRFGAASATCGGTYPNTATATLSLGGNGSTAGINGFAIPASTLGPQMSFNIWYNFEPAYDGAWLAYSTTGAAGPWTNVGDTTSATAPYISAGGYDGTLNSSSSTRIWTSTNTGSNGSLKAVTVNLNSLAGQTVWFAFRASTDGSVVSEGFYVDDVRINADGYGSCTTNLPPPGPAVAYQLTGLPASVQAGSPATFNLTAVDSLGQTATSYNGTASFTSTDPQALLPASATFAAGVASNVSVDFRTLGAQSLTASDTVSPAISGSGSTTVTAGAAAGLTFTVQPSDSAAGTSIAPSVRVGLVDQFGNAVTTGTQSVTVALGNNPAGGTLSGTTTATMVAGVATFSTLSLDKAATGYTLAASSTGLTGATSDGFAITAGAAASLAYLTQPSNTGAGVSIAPAVQVALLDAFGNATASTDDVTVALGNNPGGGPLGGTTRVAAVNGVATFSDLSIARMGSGYTLEASSGALPRITSSGFDITAGPPHRVTITQQPSDVIAGAVIAPAVQATLYDRYGNLATLATTPVSISLGNNPTGGTLGGTTTIAAAGGVATFSNLSVDRAGFNYTLVAGASGIYSDTSVGFDVGVGAPAALAFTASPSGNVTSGAAFTARVAVRDAGGNLVTGAPTQVTLSLTNAAGATLSGTPVATTVNGVATFTGLSVDQAGSGYALQANATGLVPATSPAFGVNPGAAAVLAFTTQPGNSTAGAAIAPAISLVLRDAQGNTVTTSSASITLALGANPSGGTLSGTRTVAASNGMATFHDLSLDKAGTGYTLQATSGALNATSNSFDVAAGAAARLAFRAAPANGTAGTALGSVQLEIRDALGNLTSSSAQVSVSLGGPAGGMLGGTTTVAASGGVATFNTLVINQAASGYTLTASTTGVQNITSGAFDIAPAAAAQLAFSTQPGNTLAGAPITPVRVSLQDAFGNQLSSSTQNVTLALAANPAGGTLSGTTTVAAVNGVATFGDLSIARAGTGYTLTASAGSLTSATSAAFDVAAGNSTRLVFRMVPSSTTAGSTLATTTVELQDANGNRVNSSLSITLSLQGGQSGTLGGTTTVAASGGLATFSNLSIARAGMGYQLVAHAAGVTDATSTAFDISHGAVAELHFTVQPGNTRAGSVISPAVRVTLQDAFGNVATSATDSVTAALGNNPRNGTLSGTKTVNAINGVATFGNLSIDKKGQGYTLRASSGALPQATSAAFDITNGGGPKLILRTVPAQVTAGEALPSIEVELQDELGNAFDDTSFNVSLGLGENTVAGQLYGRATVGSTNGVAKFDGLTLRKAGNGYTLVATAQGFEGATSTAFTVVPAAAANYALTFPASVTAGQEATLSATAYDAYGNQASSYGGSVKVTSSDSAATYSANATFVEGVLQSLKVTFKTSGLRTLTVTDTEKDTLAATAQLNVTPFAQPTVAVTDPVGGTSVNGSVSINASAAVAPGTTVAKLQILVDGKEIASGSDATLAGSWNSDEAEGGSHVITAIVTDGAGNMVNSAPVIVFTEIDTGCGCGATSGTDAGIYLLLLVLARFVLGRSRRQNAA
ncbi:S8 family serine peptidase [Hyalangium sp.]|uniref:S8 family serine peptidase n=1 Tax=Hyalangium sp. TaxID=2028555 RepID=UPI002D772494|nr:S8 family serine peptidase [Hyalangium sp.]